MKPLTVFYFYITSALTSCDLSWAFTVKAIHKHGNLASASSSRQRIKRKPICKLKHDEPISTASTRTLQASEDDRTYDNMGILTPIAETLDAATGDWALSYADLSPATPKTPAGVSFLLTNICYAVVGISMISQGDLFYGTLVEIAGIVSFWYHYSQLELGQNRSEVRLALLTDYFTAGAALITGGVYMLQMGLTKIPFDTFVAMVGSLVALALCWVWEFGYPYLVLHSIWHVGSSYTGYLIGQAHIDSML